MKYYLDQLQAHSGSAAFGGGGVVAPVNIGLALICEEGRLVLDMRGVLERARMTFPTVAHFNLLIDIPDDSGRYLVAQAELCPPGMSVIDLQALPPWLAFR
jgi:hypothetical protein